MALQSASVSFTGLSTLPDDYLCPDGCLAFATNAVWEDGALKTYPPAAAKGLLVAAGDRVYLHSTASYTHYIVAHQLTVSGTDADGNEISGNELWLFWVDAADCAAAAEKGTYVSCAGAVPWDNANVNQIKNAEGDGLVAEGSLVDMTMLGNTVVMSTSEGTHYLIWKADDGKYVYLGTRVPEVDMRWGLSLTVGRSVYLKTGITLEDATSVSAGETYTPVCYIYYDHDSVGRLDYYTANKCQPKANTKYRCYQYITSSKKSHPTLYADRGSSKYDVDDDKMCLVPKSQKEYKYFTTKDRDDYIDFHVTVARRKACGYVFIEECTGGSTVVTANQIENTLDNHTAVMGLMNKFVNEQGKKNNRFVYPFFLRYAVKLYDGSYVNLGSPVLLYPNTGYAPFFKLIPQASGQKAELYAFVGDLQFELLSVLGDEWEDLVQSVGVFVTPGVYCYDQGQAFEEGVDSFEYLYYRVQGVTTTSNNNLIDQLTDTCYGIGRYDGGCSDGTDNSTRDKADDDDDGAFLTDGGSVSSTKNNVEETDSFGEEFAPTDLVEPVVNNFNYGINVTNTSQNCVVTVRIAARKTGEINEQLLSSCSFYKIAEIGFEHLKETGSYELLLEDGILNALEARETLGENVIASTDFLGQNLFVYNNRLHMYGGSRLLPTAAGTMRQNGYCYTPSEDKRSWVKIRTDEGVRTVACKGGPMYMAPWFFYPDSRAFQYIEEAPDTRCRTEEETVDDGNVVSTTELDLITYDLQPHDFLNGAYLLRDVNDFCRSVLDIVVGETDTETRASTEVTIGDMADTASEDTDLGENAALSNLNKIYVSDASNPFVFRNAMVCTAGAGQVLALSCAARALSQGQFGQFPLYAFTDEGIWAITVASDGSYSTSQPMARDVATNVAAVTQLDSEVLFMSDRGVMVATGSEVTCLSDSIDGDFGQLNPLELPVFRDFCGRFLDLDETETARRVEAWAGQPFFDFLKECLVKYDYIHQRLVVYSPKAGVAYTYSLKSRQWGMMLTDLQGGVNSYPNALALRAADGGWELADLSEYDGSVTSQRIVMVTRPLKLGGPDVMKTVDSLVVRGYFRQSLAENRIRGMVLYGSRDLFRWDVVAARGSSLDSEGRAAALPSMMTGLAGSPYKAFRLMVAADLGVRENLAGLELMFEPRAEGKLR